MHLFRRLFAQTRPAENGMDKPTPTPIPPDNSDPSNIDTSQLITQEIAFTPDAPDGVTRPLPQESLMSFLGGDHLIFGQLSDVGVVRSNNQDAAFSTFSTSRSAEERPDFGVFIIADGMGGHHDGEKASAMTTRTVASHIISNVYVPMLTGANENTMSITEILVAAAEKANAEVLANVPDGGTTLSAVVVIGDLAYVAHVGDSRIYLQTKDGLEQLTRDHSLVQRLIELDQLTQEEAAEHPQKNVLYRALGQSETIEVDTLTRRLPSKARLLLCSDGLWNQVPERDIQDIVKQGSNPQDSCNKLVALANKHGGVDNVSVILLHLPG